ncbi:hypothetical protein Cgig2_019594 [Carnegiea gigantea]|uniref:J domain-containing protein n=1 Tax=Carnegiea gigantea TaxID=171969 RepID=A0A9Q1KJ26_9CARY|nr:hypothetical protein Cgig2_019594 [Carnegiea gigantea]
MLSSSQSLPCSSVRLQFSRSKSIAGKPLSSPNVVGFRRPLAISAACATASAETASSSFYDVLGISVGATSDEIKAAYRRRARSCHPDVAASGRERKSAAADEFMRVHAAYSTLSDPEKRADYDRRLSRRIRPPLAMNQFSGLSASPASSSSSFYRFPRRTWETDQC